ncbi:MAG TPA: hypothetical protein DCO71_10190 [Gammaproteobacteria bacterium]|nr:hypothetical protein [Gammaproteobacteria bacterium]
MAISALASPASADTVNARCDIYPKGEDHALDSIPCTFSQRQGYIRIDREDGISHDLSPVGDTPGNYVDQSGHPVYRQSDLGKDGLIFRMPTESVYVYWDASSL